ncbi:MAG: 16S rRNA (guanine(966)-N(2))-methyltransferase RsmD [Mariprofundales bacterium]
MRITAGEFRGRVWPTLTLPGIRPTSSRVREALFNILGDVSDWRILDLFSGSGLMAIEALSRGCSHVTSIEKNPLACRHLRQQQKQWQLQINWHIIQSSCERALPRLLSKQSFNLIYADPPYDNELAQQIPVWLTANHIKSNILIIEESIRVTVQWPQGWQLFDKRQYGQSCLYFLEETSNADGSLSGNI